MRPVARRIGMLVLAIACMAVLNPTAAVRAQGRIYINSTADPSPRETQFCMEGGDCPLRRAIFTAQDSQIGAIVTVCFDPAEVPGARPCPTGIRPLRKSDPSYDASIDRWVIKLRHSVPIVMSAKQTFIDFRFHLDWESPADNKLIIDAGDLEMDHAFAMQSDRNIIAGFEIRGAFDRAAVLIRGLSQEQQAKNNQVGPGVIFANMSSGSGVHIVSGNSIGNKVIGNWCGITGDGTVVSPLTDDCVYLEQGATGSIIGDASPAGRNIFAATSKGTGVRMEDPAGDELPVRTRDNAVEYNWFGLDVNGDATEGLDTGILINDSPFNAIRHNLISGSRSAGVAVTGRVTGTLITDNTIGTSQDGRTCRPNNGDGILLVGGPRETRIERNRITCNRKSGVGIQGPTTYDNTLSQNSIGGNEEDPITVTSGANDSVRPPEIERDSIDVRSVSGMACPNCLVEIYSDDDRQSQYYEGSVTAGEDGLFAYSQEETYYGRFVTALQTDGLNSSALARSYLIPGVRPTRVPTDTPPPPTWTPDPSIDPVTPGPTQPIEPTPVDTIDPTTLPFKNYLPMTLNADEGRGVGLALAGEGRGEIHYR